MLVLKLAECVIRNRVSMCFERLECEISYVFQVEMSGGEDEHTVLCQTL